MELSPPQRRVRRRCHRLINSRHPPIGPFDFARDEEELETLYLIEGLTNDRIGETLDRLRRLPPEERVMGAANATVIMAAFCHPSPSGARFSTSRVGAWYAAFDLDTAVVETVHHNTRRLATSAIGFHARIQLREYLASVDTRLHDIRGWRELAPELYDPDDYARSQTWAEQLRGDGSNGILYHSVRREGGRNVAIFCPRLLRDVTQGCHVEYRWTGSSEPEIRRLTS